MKIRNWFKRLWAALFRRKKPADRLVQVWTQVFSGNAPLFSGLYGSLAKLSQGKLKRKDPLLKEWCARVESSLEGEAKTLTAERIQPLIGGAEEPARQLAAKLLEAARAGGVTWDQAETLTLEEETCRAYGSLGPEEFAPGDRVRVLSPAWYFRGELLERGMAVRM